jgi:transcriptional regulator with XRE-family HTH domain
MTPKNRVEEIRLARGLSKIELCRLSGMPPQTLQNIENGKTKTVTDSARRLLAPALQVRPDQLLLPVGFPFDPEPGEPIFEVLSRTFEAILAELREIKTMLRAILPAPPPAPSTEEEYPDEPSEVFEAIPEVPA